MDVGRVVREARRRVGLTQRELGRRTGVPQPSIARIEAGRTIPRVDTLERLLRGCGEGLYVDALRAVGIDRTLIASWRRLTPAQRLRVAEDRPSYGGRQGARRWRPEDALEHLRSFEVRFVVIGAVAAELLGAPVVTFDTDVCYSREAGNLERLAGALQACHAALRAAPEEVPTPIDLRRLRSSLNLTLDTDFGPLDLLAEPAGVGGFDELIRNAVTRRLGSVEVLVASLSDLIRMKRAAGRRKDLMMLEDLEALQEELDATPDPE